jgi:hypothetical protein
MLLSKSVSLLLTITVLLVACTPKPEIIKRYANVRYEPEDSSRQQPFATFFSLPIPQDKKEKTIFDLSDRGQAALIKGLAEDTKKPEELLAAASRKLENFRTNPADVDLTNFKRRVVFTVGRGSSRPADRLAWLRINLSISSSDYVFRSWDKAATVYERIDLGKLELSQEQSAKPTSSLAGFGSNIGLDVSRSAKLVESQDQRRRIVDLNVSLPSNAIATVVRQGAPDRDLDGNTVIDFDIKYKGKVCSKDLVKFSNLKEEDEPTSVEDIKMHLYEAKYPKVAKDIEAVALMTYDFRKVTKGDDSINEGDDSITVIHGTTDSVTRMLIPESAQRLTAGRLTDLKEETVITWDWERYEDSGRRGRLHCKDAGETEQLLFRTLNDAWDLLYWLVLHQARANSEDEIVVTSDNLALCLVTETAKETEKEKEIECECEKENECEKEKPIRPLTWEDVEKLWAWHWDLN